MKLGIEINWQSNRFDINRERLSLADRIGYDMVFTAEGNGSDALTPLGYILAATDRIGIGTHIAPTIGRSPAVMAMAFQTLRQLAGPDREIVAGLGSHAKEYAEAWHGAEWTQPYNRMKDFVSIMKQAASGAPVDYDGKVLSVPVRVPGQQRSELRLPRLLETDPHIPIMFGGGSELMMTLAAEVADGLMPLGYAPGMMPTYRKFLDNGNQKRAHPVNMDEFPVWSHCDVMLTDDVGEAIQQFKAYTARWAGGWNSAPGLPNPFANQMIWRGYGEAQQRIEELYLAGHEQEAIDAVPDEYIEEGWLFGSMDRVLRGWKDRWIHQGVNIIVRTDNWPSAGLAGNAVYEPLLAAARD
jgi:alkanesulfonate monooxygenase SsuD/methylene tetrahydromethanopterin reductase-like flavin-dependent oxidoreductase (luciferase family)